MVVRDLSESGVGGTEAAREAGELPSALTALPQILGRTGKGRVALFLDYDGVLTPIVRRPEEAVLSEGMRRTVEELAVLCPVAVVSGRDLADVRILVGVDSVIYAGSHGFDILGAQGRHMEFQQGKDYLPDLAEAEKKLQDSLQDIPGSRVERKKFAIAVHFREVRPDDVPRVEQIVEEVRRNLPRLRTSGGKKVIELRPDIDWDKGKAVNWLLESLGLDRPDILPLYLGDDLTDEDAFRELRSRGIGILVRDEDRPTLAHFTLENPEEVRTFLQELTAALRCGK
jgi:trehalose 6-phosphate phosphatase